MIKSFKHKGLRRFFESGTTRGIQIAHADKLELQLDALDTAVGIEDMRLPGWRLHTLKGQHAGRWLVTVTVNGNWCITFEAKDGDAYVLDYEDYH
jgi:proteic killer suppression protein